ncbi:helix-turn-helix transcriptional regulator, partial [Georgenia sp. Z1491]|uniref:helix-turn-helix transcriptional regulator n=1 Tax=Georgenia sp. Z1491 TaxID=3416707 RepID=UPI003CEC9D2C
LYPNEIQMLHVGEAENTRLGLLLDEVADLTEAAPSASGYFRTHALVFTVLATLAPYIRHAPVPVPPLTSRQRAVRVAPPRWRAFQPVRREIARTAALIQNDIARRWSLSELAAHACLSTSRYGQLFKESFGVTPLTYLSILRVQEMARLIRETDLLIGTITDRVGWCQHCGHATLVFRRYMGVTPFEYRHYGPPTASHEGPGLGAVTGSSPTPCPGEPRSDAPARSRSRPGRGLFA